MNGIKSSGVGELNGGGSIEGALRFVADLAVKADGRRTPEFVPHPDGSGLRKMVVEYPAEGGAKISVTDVVPEARCYRATSVGSLIDLIGEFAVGHEDLPGDIFVFVHEGEVDVLLGETQRRECLVLTLEKSDQFKALEALAEKPQKFEHREFLTLLKTGLNARYLPDDLVSLLSKLKFKSDAAGQSTIGAGNVSMGKAVEQRVAGLDDRQLPEFVAVQLPVYTNLYGDGGQVRFDSFSCDLQIDLTEQRFSLRPRAGEIQRALLDIDNDLAAQIGKGVDDLLNARKPVISANGEPVKVKRVLVFRGESNVV